MGINITNILYRNQVTTYPLSLREIRKCIVKGFMRDANGQICPQARFHGDAQLSNKLSFVLHTRH